MELKQSLNVTQQQKLFLTPKLKQALYLLQLPFLELKSFIEQQVVENPVLEQKEFFPDNDIQKTEDIIKKENSYYIINDDEGYSPEQIQKRSYFESLITKPESLEEHLLSQLRLSVSSGIEQQIGELIIGNIDDNGYLKITIDELTKIPALCKCEYLVKKVLTLIQSFDPSGIGAANLKECLLIQLTQQGKANSLSFKLVEKHLKDLEKKNYKQISSKTGASLEEIKKAVTQISHLEPKPGRIFNTEKTRYPTIDISIRKTEDRYEAVLNKTGMPFLNISKTYKKMLKDPSVSKETKKYIKNNIISGQWLIKTINQRDTTLQKTAQAIIDIQKDFLEKGLDYLKPMKLKEVAEKIKMHESTISRVITNKYLLSPYGIFELRYFFSQGTKDTAGKDISSKNIQSKIKELIANESKTKPLSDSKIVDILKKDGINIARRTVAKYRTALKILPASMRKK